LILLAAQAGDGSGAGVETPSRWGGSCG
jgi:hypothetical protein